jgi:hypothetical protein
VHVFFHRFPDALLSHPSADCGQTRAGRKSGRLTHDDGFLSQDFWVETLSLAQEVIAVTCQPLPQ